MIRRDAILAMARGGDWYSLSDLRNSFGTMTPPERRAFIVASYSLKDEGDHWRKFTRNQFSPFEVFLRDWAASRIGRPGWAIPL
jgi:hypothetical protein